MIGSRATLGLLEYLGEVGCDAAPLLRRTELAASLFAEPEALLPLARFVRFLELCAQASGDDCFGAHYASHYPIRNTGLAGYATIGSTTLGSGCNAVARYYALLADATELTLTTHGPRARLSYTLTDSSIWPRRQDAECMLTVLLGWLRDALGAAWSPEEVWFEHAKPSGARALMRIYRCPMHFDMPCNALFFPRSLLERRLHSEHPDLAGLIEPYLEELLRQKAQPAQVDQAVIKHIKSSLSHSPASLAEAARDQGVGARTLQRRLRAHGQSYQKLVDRARYESSLAYLADRSLSIGEVACKLGYADVTAFNRAFRRWTGQAPSHYRRVVAAAPTACSQPERRAAQPK
ncbi:MAG: AraC family transcriptional regulator [Myxococcales bacterium]